MRAMKGYTFQLFSHGKSDPPASGRGWGSSRVIFRRERNPGSDRPHIAIVSRGLIQAVLAFLHCLWGR